MGSQIASKNLYELLGNDPELDPDREPEPPTKAVDKPVQRAGKRNAGAEGPAKDTPRPAAGGRGGRHEVFTRADQAGSLNNRAELRDDGLRQDRHANRVREPREFRGRGSRGGRGSGGRGAKGARDDRHSHTGIGEHDKQAAHGWGGTDGEAEWTDEKAGEAIAQAEAKDEPGAATETSGADPAFSNGADGPAADDEAAALAEENKTKSYDEWLAEQAEKRLALAGDGPAVRKANEGSKQKFPEGTAFHRNPEEENFMVGSSSKQRKQKEAKEKDTLVVEGQYYAPIEQDRGPRGRGRGGRGDRGGRGTGRGRGGEFRGAPRGGGDFRGAPRGGPRGGTRGGLNTSDESAFPSLGGK